MGCLNTKQHRERACDVEPVSRMVVWTIKCYASHTDVIDSAHCRPKGGPCMGHAAAHTLYLEKGISLHDALQL